MYLVVSMLKLNKNVIAIEVSLENVKTENSTRIPPV